LSHFVSLLVQMEENDLDSLVEGLVVPFWAAFTIDISLLCVLRTITGYR
jgi:hypothetical protein